jgi:hypothetical protein
MSNLDHMNMLDRIAASDIAVLREKERTYKGSWKAAGGRSAWFMARRNLDRLINMLSPKDYSAVDCVDYLEHKLNNGGIQPTNLDAAEQLKKIREQLIAEDIFERIKNAPSGNDGTVLAVMRDARRYFMLVEAEMVARGVVIPELELQPSSIVKINTTKNPEVDTVEFKPEETLPELILDESLKDFSADYYSPLIWLYDSIKDMNIPVYKLIPMYADRSRSRGFLVSHLIRDKMPFYCWNNLLCCYIKASIWWKKSRDAHLDVTGYHKFKLNDDDDDVTIYVMQPEIIPSHLKNVLYYEFPKQLERPRSSLPATYQHVYTYDGVLRSGFNGAYYTLGTV